MIVALSSLTDAEMGALIGLSFYEDLDPTDYVVHRSENGAAYTVGLDDQEHRLTSED